jgi:hypothetical protein
MQDETSFKLPIEYLDTKVVHNLPDVVVNDLELVDAGSRSPMYDILLTPQNAFAKSMIQKWKSKFSSDADFIKESQEVLKTVIRKEDVVVDTASLSEIWKDLYETPNFHDRYSYIDIKHFQFINQLSTFMGVWTAINLISPLFSIMLPLILIVAPFVLLKIQSVPITFDIYLTTLKEMAKKHAVGKAFSSIDSGGLNNWLYILFTLAMYAIQMYQNVRSCMRFYSNISVVNKNLLTLKEFVNYSIESFEDYLSKNRGLTKYRGFCDDVALHHSYLLSLKEELRDVKPFTFSVSKIFEVGYLLKCYYCLFSVPEHKKAFSYAMSFEGYRSNLESLSRHVKSGTVNFGEIRKDKSTSFTNQIYPALMDDPVYNSVNLKKNLIITGPNASGKTTQLKTTAINIIFTQQFGVGFYEKCTLAPYTHIHSYLNIPDTSGRDSLFQAEARRCKEIIDIIDREDGEDSRHFCVFDELFSGTNAEEATEVSFGFLKYLQKYANVDFILTTHFIKLCRKVKKSSNSLRIENYKMDAELVGDNIVFSYKFVRGISKIKAAKLILMQMGFPEEIYK